MDMQAKVQTEVLKEAATTGMVDVVEVCSHVPGADCRDVARAVELLTARHAIDLPDGPNAADTEIPVAPLLGYGPPVDVQVTLPAQTRVLLLPDAMVDLRTAAACLDVEFRDVVAGVARGEIRAADADPGRPGVWLVRAGDLHAWGRRRGARPARDAAPSIRPGATREVSRWRDGSGPGPRSAPSTTGPERVERWRPER